jgi:hypothetical protein
VVVVVVAVVDVVEVVVVVVVVDVVVGSLKEFLCVLNYISFSYEY